MTPEVQKLAQRAALLLRSTHFVTLATVSPTGEPWASTVGYVHTLDGSVRLVWYSMREARHSRNIEHQPLVTGSIFRTDLGASAALGLDGLQFQARAQAVEGPRFEQTREHFYRLNFPDEQVRRQWMLPESEFIGAGPRRFYEATLEAWWLLDVDQWLVDKRDMRIALPAPATFVELAASGALAA
ncbi:pyridoxamine 5'-phosphate oxidase family protein [Corallococcus terminator]